MSNVWLASGFSLSFHFLLGETVPWNCSGLLTLLCWQWKPQSQLQEPAAKGVRKKLFVSASWGNSQVPEYSAACRASVITSCQKVPWRSCVRDTILSRFAAVLNCMGRSNHSCWPPGLEVTKRCLLPKPDTLQSWTECSLVEAEDPAQRSVQMFPFHVAWYCNTLP